MGGGGLVKDLKKIVREIGIQSFIEQEYHITNKNALKSMDPAFQINYVNFTKNR